MSDRVSRVSEACRAFTRSLLRAHAGSMTRAEQIRERLEEIEAELTAAPHYRPAKPGADVPELLADLESFLPVREWEDRKPALIEELRQLRREYERLP